MAGKRVRDEGRGPGRPRDERVDRAVLDAVVDLVAEKGLGAVPMDAVALRPGAEATPEELREFVRGQVAAYKYPRVVWLVDALPKGATGKILKREVAATRP
ncbi:hypothetical protein [Streptomyces sp. NPDC093105]|uniref:AMP-binding enzyme n=1 Tax=Streptomyces sp. NPDC093105 TaxID=3366029 RepID=UPI003805A755